MGVLLIVCAIPLTMAAQITDTDKKLLELEKQLESLKAQIEELKAATHPSAVPATAPATTAAVATPAPAAAPAAAAPAPNPLAGITSVLGGVNLTGVVDAYYGYNANHPSISHNGGTLNEPFTFVNNQFSLNLLELQLDKPVDKESRLGFRTAFFWGQAANAVNNTGNSYFAPDLASSTNAAQYLKEAYLSYFAPIGKGLQLDVGKWATPTGVEVIEGNQNNNYSRGLLFTYAIPYYHMGARAKYVFNDKWTVSGYMTNGWNNVIASNSGKTGGVSIAYSPNKKLTITENYLGGPRDYFATGNNSAWSNLFDTIVTYNPTAKLSLAAEADYNRIEEFWRPYGGGGGYYTNKPADYTGLALFAKYQFRPKTAFSARYEYLNDHDGFATPISYFGIANGQHLNEFTATAERKFAGHLISRLEYRHDASNQTFFSRGNSFGSVKGQSTVDVGLIFVLEPGDTK